MVVGVGGADVRQTGLRITGQDESGLLRLAPGSGQREASVAGLLPAIAAVALAAFIALALAGAGALLHWLAGHVPPPPAWLTAAGLQPGVIWVGCLAGAVGIGLVLALGRMQYREVAGQAADRREMSGSEDWCFLDEEDDEGEGYPYDYSLFD